MNVFPTHDVLFDWTWAEFLILNEVTDGEADVSPPDAAQTPALASSINLLRVSYSTPSFPLTVNDENMKKMVKFLYIKFVWWKTNLYEKCDFLLPKEKSDRRMENEENFSRFSRDSCHDTSHTHKI